MYYTEFDLKKITAIIKDFSTSYLTENFFKKDKLDINVESFFDKDTTLYDFLPIFGPPTKAWTELMEQGFKKSDSMTLLLVTFRFNTLRELFSEGYKEGVYSLFQLHVYEDTCSVSVSLEVGDDDLSWESSEEGLRLITEKCMVTFKKFTPEENLVYSDWRDGIQEFLKRIMSMVSELKTS